MEQNPDFPKVKPWSLRLNSYRIFEKNWSPDVRCTVATQHQRRLSRDWDLCIECQTIFRYTDVFWRFHSALSAAHPSLPFLRQNNYFPPSVNHFAARRTILQVKQQTTRCVQVFWFSILGASYPSQRKRSDLWSRVHICVILSLRAIRARIRLAMFARSSRARTSSSGPFSSADSRRSSALTRCSSRSASGTCCCGRHCCAPSLRMYVRLP